MVESALHRYNGWPMAACIDEIITHNSMDGKLILSNSNSS